MHFMRVFVDWLHLAMAVIWIGGIHYHLVVLGGAAKEIGTNERGTLALGTFRRFTRIVWASIVLLVVTGLLKGVYLRAFSGLFMTNYGWILGVKLLLVIAMIVVASLFSFVFGPELKRIVASESEDTRNELADLLMKMTTLVRVNMLFGFLVLLAAVMLAMNP